MLYIDLVVRAAAGTLALLFAVLMLRDTRQMHTSFYFLLVSIGLCAFLMGNTTIILFPTDTVAGATRDILSRHLAIFIWWFCLSIFDDEFRISRLEVGVTLAWLLFFLIGYVDAAPDYLSWGSVGLGLFIVGHIAWRLVSDRPFDLVEGRRKYRYIVAAMPASLLLIDLMIDLFFGFNWKPLGFTLAQNLSILAMVLGLCIWGLDVSMHRVTFADQPVPAGAPQQPHIMPADRKVYEILLGLMVDEQLFLRPDLKLSDLTNRLGIGEVRLRRLINQGFGCRNFRQFLNAYRLKFACSRLSASTHANDKIVSIALDSGFASLASFNRVFKNAYECTPSEYRRDAFADKEAETGFLPSSKMPKTGF